MDFSLGLLFGQKEKSSNKQKSEADKMFAGVYNHEDLAQRKKERHRNSLILILP